MGKPWSISANSSAPLKDLIILIDNDGAGTPRNIQHPEIHWSDWRINTEIQKLWEDTTQM